MEAWLVKRQAKDQLQSAEQGLSLMEEELGDRYDTLAPKTINDASMREYFIALKYALSQKDVRNIAITGSFLWRREKYGYFIIYEISLR
ncbi:hypothetical protein OH693_12080 [Escherichia coli]|nr:hypothetical protein [Escherichia coli]